VTITRRFTSTGPDETRAIGEAIGASLAPGALVLLRGPLGAGKTVLTAGIARALGVEDTIISPTYTIIADYPGRIPLAHVDLYRIEGGAQLDGLGLDDLIGGAGVTVVEWGEKLDPERARGAVRVTISVPTDGTRLVLVEEPVA
jgi:tRNA threonylcarbamoyladenosine biosynthesis protein TsaE